MPATVRIFLSTVSDEFCAYRDRLRSDLTRPNVEVKVQEDFKDLGGATLETLDAYIEICDAVVHLVGDGTGTVAGASSTAAILTRYPDLPNKLPPLAAALRDGVAISYTQWEAWLALYHDKKLLIAKADPAAPRGASCRPTDESRAAQQAHLARLAAVEHFPRGAFTSPESLSSQIAYTTILDLLAKAQSASDTSVARGSLRILGPALAGLVGAFATWLLVRSAALGATETLLLVGVGIGCAAMPVAYNYYLGVLAQGTAPPGSVERCDYDRLRASLEGDKLAARLYTKWLRKMLDWVERFFGDAGMADRSLFPHAFGLTVPAPLWTAPAFDRCLFLSLIYPVVTIVSIWAMSGQVGPAEHALGLAGDVPGWLRALIIGAVAVEGLALWRFTRRRSRARLAVACITAVAIAIAFAVAFDSLGSGVAAFAAAVAFAVAGAGRIAGAVIVGIAVAAGFAFAIAGTELQLFVLWLGAAAFVVGAVLLVCKVAIDHGRQGVFLALFIPASLVACLGAAALLARLPTWQHTGPLLLFLALLTLVNAPCAWASLGLTRALLRRGLELGGWWPYALGLTDAAAAVVVVAVLALGAVVAVQAFDHLAMQGGGAEAVVLRLDQLIAGIVQNPAEPEFWWLYALLLSAMIPSLVNLVIGGMALTRGIPRLARTLAGWVPVDGKLPAYKRQPVAIGLTLEMFSGALLGIAAQVLLAWGFVFHLMPRLGLDLLDLAGAVVDFNVPARIDGLLFGCP